MKQKITLFGLLLLGASIGYAQDSTKTEAFIPSGKVNFEVHGNFNVHLTSADNADNAIEETAMEISRAYLGYTYQFKPAFSTKIMFDVSSKSDDNDSDRFIFLKTASLNYKKNNLAIDLGLIDLYQHKVQEKYWGHRYIYKSAQDEYKFCQSADAAVLAKYSINEMFMVDAIIRNGEGYKKVQGDNKYVVGGGVTVEPMEGLAVRMFFDVLLDSTNNQSSLATFVGYKKDGLGSFGAEYNIRMNENFNEDYDRSVLSFYGTYFINDKYNVFARYDSHTYPLLPLTETETEGYLILGAEFIPFKQINTSLNFRTDADESHAIFLNLRVKI